MDSKHLMIFINIAIYLIIQNIKFRRYAKPNIRKRINAIFSGLIFVVMLILLNTTIWNTKIITYIDSALFLFILSGMLYLVLKNRRTIKNTTIIIFQKKSNIIEFFFLSIILILPFLNNSLWLLSFIVLLIFLLKEVLLISETLNRLFDRGN
jgi:hypothetical protein